MVASNKQMVELTYLCFVFLNDRSDAWWEMQWAACQGRDNSRERGPVEAAYIPNLVPSLWFLRLVIFFALLLAVARAAVPQPPSLPNYHLHTDRQAADGETSRVHEEIQFTNETNVLHWGGRREGPKGGGWCGDPGLNRIWFKPGLDLGKKVQPVGPWQELDPSYIYLFA